MTRLVTAQRHSAWREVARRIAHEIKNPLTPIQPDLRGLINEVLFAQGVAFPEIEFFLDDKTNGDLMAMCDERLITQALTNVYKNAGESVTRRFDATGADDLKGLVRTQITETKTHIKLRITDNGMGWPFPDKERLLEPYVTTRDSGTGLGYNQRTWHR